MHHQQVIASLCTQDQCVSSPHLPTRPSHPTGVRLMGWTGAGWVAGWLAGCEEYLCWPLKTSSHCSPDPTRRYERANPRCAEELRLTRGRGRVGLRRRVCGWLPSTASGQDQQLKCTTLPVAIKSCSVNGSPRTRRPLPHRRLHEQILFMSCDSDDQSCGVAESTEL